MIKYTPIEEGAKGHRLHMAWRAPARFSTERIGGKLTINGPIEASPVPPGRGKRANPRPIFDSPAEKARIADWLAERGGFEPPRPFRILAAELNSSLAHYSVRTKHPCRSEFVCLRIRLCFRSLCFPSFSYAERGIADVKHQTKVWSSNLPS